jgi:hypothetical protein
MIGALFALLDGSVFKRDTETYHHTAVSGSHYTITYASGDFGDCDD